MQPLSANRMVNLRGLFKTQSNLSSLDIWVSSKYASKPSTLSAIYNNNDLKHRRSWEGYLHVIIKDNCSSSYLSFVISK